MRTVTVEKRIEAPQRAVWEVLADFPNIADWNSGVKASRATSDAVSGVGATRHCDLAPVGGLDETIRRWEPDSRMVVSIDTATKLPIAYAEADFTLDGDDEATTATTLAYSYRTKWGPVGRLMQPLLDRQFRRGFAGFLDDLDTAARRAAV